jgi:lysophospholipase L1-like esterase
MKNLGTIFAVGLLALSFGIACREKPVRELTICCAGDSLMRPMPYYFKKLLRNIAKDVEIDDWSRGGLSTRTYMPFFRRHVRSQGRLTADFVLLQLGTNDVAALGSGELTLEKFSQKLKAITWEFKSIRNKNNVPAGVLLANIPPLYAPEFEGLNSYICDVLNPAIMQIAEEKGLFLVDNWLALEGKRHLYDSDGVHPNAMGERVLAQNWVRALHNAARLRKP